MKRTLESLAALTALACLVLPAESATIRYTPFATGLNTPAGIDYHEPSNSLIVSVNYPTGDPHNFVRINMVTGAHTPFTSVASWFDEIKIGSVRSGGPGGFQVGDLFSGNGVPGQIARISNNGATVQTVWTSLPGAGLGLMRGAFHVDRTGIYGGDLLAATTNGRLFRVNPAGVATQLADLGGRGTEGMAVVPNDPARYGPLAGRILLGGQDQHRLYAINAVGNILSFDVGFEIEDIDLIVPNSVFFGLDHDNGRVMMADPTNFVGFEGDFLVINEHPRQGESGLYRLFWDGAQVRLEQFDRAPGSPFVSLWEHGTIIGAASAVPEPGTLTIAAIASLGLLGCGWRRWRASGSR